MSEASSKGETEKGFWKHDMTLVKSGHLCLCRWCGDVHEGTMGYGLAHWRECVGIATYGRAKAMGIDTPTATQLATFMYRDFPRVWDRERDWSMRDLASREGLIEMTLTNV